jgi:hypothetical protein
MAKKRRSRLKRKQEIRNIRQAVLFGFLTLLIALGLIFLGIPALIRLAIFLGDIRDSSQPVESSDTIPPAQVRLNFLPEATNSALINLKGYAEAGSTVEVFLNKQSEKKVVAENEGTFIANQLKLKEGENEIAATATDENGNVSQRSETMKILFDQTPPELTITEPKEGAEFYGNERRITLKGETESDTAVTINGRLIINNDHTKFEHQINLNEGENTIKITATDLAGNQVEKEIKVIYNP